MTDPRLPQLGDLELTTLEHLWTHGAQDVTAVHDAVGRPRKVTRNTIQSTLRRLYDKGLLTRSKVSHAFVYAPVMDRAEFRRRSLEEALGRLADRGTNDLLSTFLDLTETASVEQLEELERLVERRIAQRRGAEGASAEAHATEPHATEPHATERHPHERDDA